MKKFLASLLLPLLLLLPTAAIADEEIHGQIQSISGHSLAVYDQRGFVDRIHLHQGTIINPTGLSLESGMTVDILGYNNGSVFEANQINTPYTIENEEDYPSYGYYGVYPENIYGGSFNTGIFFGGGYHGGYHGGDYRGGHNSNFHGPHDGHGGPGIHGGNPGGHGGGESHGGGGGRPH